MDLRFSSILVVVNGEPIGDGLSKLPFVHALRNLCPDADISWCLMKHGSVYDDEIASLVHGKIDNIIHSYKFSTLRKAIHGKSYDLIIDTRSSFLSSLYVKYSVRHRYFYSKAAKYLLSDFKAGCDVPYPKKLIDRMLSILQDMGFQVDFTKKPLSIPSHFTDLAEKLLPASNYIGLVPGAGNVIKCWPLKNYIKLASLLHNRGLLPVMIIGPQEQKMYDAIKQQVPYAIFPLQDKMVGDISPLLTIALGARMKVAVSNDCGAGHMLAASQVNLISLFGPTSAEKFAPDISNGRIIDANKFGSSNIDIIPVEYVCNAIIEMID